MKRSGLFAAAGRSGCAVLSAPGSRGCHPNSAETYKQLNLFGEVFERVRAEYVDDVSDNSLVESAINGMLTSLDPHSNYLNTKNFNDMKVQTRGEFGGLGIEVSMENGLVKVVSPIDDTPAARAGLKPGDLITHLDGRAGPRDDPAGSGRKNARSGQQRDQADDPARGARSLRCQADPGDDQDSVGPLPSRGRQYRLHPGNDLQ